ncbi:hypothetical protein THMIRHAM_05790 [Thiomicrorhabdus immobilis]|uniref:DUF72 domain-containing protein n=1 Tax=Thiomicrorhabdus immobilis TaxID=2791037 RepID=A0ABM7MBV4_9GAMM|nr:hypothetical protein [Thiomicrorhabdus immobilis]BCN92794.1 hypothetical protein THMIRHAM_05790 [Thiomicrorhabdus immobilis]
MENLQVGAYGWQYASWVGAFYPEDIPKEWQLDFYSNAYRVLLVPESIWLQWSEGELEELLDSVEEDFSFFFEVDGSFSEPKRVQLNRVVEAFGGCVKGVVVISEQDEVAVEYCGLPVTLVSEKNTLPGWQWSHAGLTCSGAPCGVVFELTTQPKEQTALLKSFMQSLPDGVEGAAFFVHSQALDMAQLYNLKTIGEFLGY